MLFAAIDIGSNAARLLFANAYEKNGLPKIEKASIIRIPIRLGEDVYRNNKISKEKIHDFVKTMQAFKLLIEVYKPISYKAYATAALRETKNSKEILKRIKKETGLKIKVIDGLLEAETIRRNKQTFFPNHKGYTLHMDVGGGSTELSIEKGNQLLQSKSFKIGTLRVLQGKIKDTVLDDINDWLQAFKNEFRSFNMLGTGGNIKKLCKVFGNNDIQQLHIKDLEVAQIKLKSLSVEERIKIYGFRPDRADVIEPAAFLFLYVMNIIKAPYIRVLRTGLADGLILEQYNDYMNNKDK